MPRAPPLGELASAARLREHRKKECGLFVDTKRRATRVTAVRVTRRGIIERFGGCFSGRTGYTDRSKGQKAAAIP